jgi:glycosyltransferase involved in cell wall biosynthesis
MDALDSVYGQTYQNFECIVANDTGKPLDVTRMGHPWVKVIDVHCGNPADSRNAAIAEAKAPLIVPLDADDMLYPNALSLLYRAWLEYPSNLSYMDCDTEDSPGHRKPYKSGLWTMQKIRKEAIYQDVILFAKQWWEAVGGYPNDVLWEDWVFGVMLHLAGVGATYIDRPWGVYRHWTALDIGHSKSDGDNAEFGTEAFTG